MCEFNVFSSLGTAPAPAPAPAPAASIAAFLVVSSQAQISTAQSRTTLQLKFVYESNQISDVSEVDFNLRFPCFAHIPNHAVVPKQVYIYIYMYIYTSLSIYIDIYTKRTCTYYKNLSNTKTRNILVSIH